MFLSWGSSRKVADVGDAGIRHCSACDKDAPFSRIVSYTSRHLYWVFRWVTQRTPLLVCGNCGASYSATDEDADPAEVRKAIPLWDRRGWLVGVGGATALVATVSFAAAADSANDKVYIAYPRAGDLYEADLAKLSTTPEAPRMYSAMRVVRADAKTVEVEIGTLFYADMRGLRRDVSSGKTAVSSYYGPQHAMFTRESIKKMYADGIFEDVKR